MLSKQADCTRQVSSWLGLRRMCFCLRGRGKCTTWKWQTKSQGVENAGLEYNGTNRKALKCRTGKWQTK